MSLLRRHRFPLFLAALCLFAYSNAFFGEYCYDDIFLIRDRKSIETWPALPLLVSKEFGPAFGDLNYRPLAPLTFFADAIVFGKRPAISRLINVALHLGVGLALFGLWRRLFRRDDLALLAAAVFLAHPIATEVVDSPGFRKDLLSALPAVGTVALLWRCAVRRSLSAGFAAAALWGVGLLAKEPAFMALALAPLVIFYDRRVFGNRSGEGNAPDSSREAKSAWRLWAPVGSAFLLVFAAWLALYIAFRPEMTFEYDKFASTKPITDTPTGSLGPALGFLNFCRAFLVYSRLWLAPVGLSVNHYFEPSTHYGDLRAWAAAFLFIAFGAASLWAFLRGLPAGVGGLWACVCFAPIAQIVPAPEWIAERYVYLSHAGVALVIASLVLGWRGSRKIRFGAGLALVMVYAGLTLWRNADWRDDLTLNIRAYELWDNTEGRVRLGALRYMAGSREKQTAGKRAAHLEKAREALSRALAEDASRAETWRVLGGVLWLLGEKEAARAHIREAFALDPDDPLNQKAMEKIGK